MADHLYSEHKLIPRKQLISTWHQTYNTRLWIEFWLYFLANGTTVADIARCRQRSHRLSSEESTDAEAHAHLARAAG
jgi:hypothetical protein